MKRYVLCAAVGLLLVVLAGCGGGHDTERDRLLDSVRALMAGWANQDSALLNRYVSLDYAFDEQGKADHIAAIEADFPDIRSFDLTGVHVELLGGGLATARVQFTAELYADISSLDQTSSIMAWAPSTNVLNQIWIKDFDGVWRLAAEYLELSWVRDNRPDITDLSIQSGDYFAPGHVAQFSAYAVERGSSYRVTLWPSCIASSLFDPDYMFGWGSATYSGEMTVRSDASGEYSFSIIGQSDATGNPRMLGRTLRAEYIVVSDTAGKSIIIGGKVVPGSKQSLFRHLRIRRAVGQYRQPHPSAAR